MAATIVDDPGFAMNQRLRCLWALFAAACLLLGAVPAAGQAPDPFVVTGVPVDVTGPSALEARSRALAEGQRAAFRRLLQRMTPEQSWPGLPAATDSNVQATVRGFQIAAERASATRYIAKLDVAFHREAVRRMLRDAGLAFTETSSRPILVLPIWRDATGVQLWEAANPWRQAWEARPERPTLAPILVPTEEQAGADAPSATVVAAGDPAALLRLAGKLGAGDVVVAEARQAGGAVEVTTTRHGPGRPEVASASFASLGAAAEELARGWDEAWKAKTILRFDATGSLKVEVPLRSMADWVKIRQRLAETSEIGKVEVAALSARAAELVLTLRGDPETLRLALRQRDLALTETAGAWRLERIDGSAPAPASEPSPPATR